MVTDFVTFLFLTMAVFIGSGAGLGVVYGYLLYRSEQARKVEIAERRKMADEYISRLYEHTWENEKTGQFKLTTNKTGTV